MSEREQSDSQVQIDNHPNEFGDTNHRHEDFEKIDYYSEYCKLYLANHILAIQLKELNLEKTELLSKLGKLEKKAEEMSEGNSGQIDEKKRRIRRSAVDIARHYKCQVQGCTKSYGSEGSLNQHIKLKHPELFKGLEAYDQNSIVKEYENEEEDSV